MTKKKLKRVVPPPSVHRLAAWISIASDLIGCPPASVQFPPTPDDMDSLCAMWTERLSELFHALETRCAKAGENNPLSLSKTSRIGKCKPFSVWYAGTGEMCEWPFCPFCMSRRAADAVERVYSMIEHPVPRDLYLACRVIRCKRKHVLDTASSLSSEVLGVNPFPGSVGRAVRIYAAPYESVAVVRGRALVAVPAGEKISCPRRWKARRIRLSPINIAVACGLYAAAPRGFFISEPKELAEVLLPLISLQLGQIHGCLKSDRPITPPYQRQVFVKPILGQAVAGPALACLRSAPEPAAARAVSEAFGLRSCWSMKALSVELGQKAIWIGRLRLKPTQVFRKTFDRVIEPAWAALEEDPEAVAIGAIPGAGIMAFCDDRSPVAKRFTGVSVLCRDPLIDQKADEDKRKRELRSILDAPDFDEEVLEDDGYEYERSVEMVGLFIPWSGGCFSSKEIGDSTCPAPPGSSLSAT